MHSLNLFHCDFFKKYINKIYFPLKMLLFLSFFFFILSEARCVQGLAELLLCNVTK